jgi:elongation factor P
MPYSAADLRKGLKIEVDGQPFIITEFSFYKPGKGAAIYNCRIKHMVSGDTQLKAYRSNDMVDKPELEEKNVTFSYAMDEERFIFTDENFEEVQVPAKILGDKRYFLQDNIACMILFHRGQPIDITLPNFVIKKVIETEPGARGNTATNVMKPAKIEGGFAIPVPLFVTQDEMIKIDTRTGTFVERVLK